jgi:probable FeS assembly SUF system protein SufT
MQTEIITSREVKAVQIPSGDSIILPAGTAVIITQTLGGSFTVATQSGLARISSEDADALGNPQDEDPENISGLPDDASLEDKVWNQLEQVFDPEIPVDIVNLGLVYDCAVNTDDDGQSTVHIKMTLTAPGCGMGPVIAADAQARVMSLDGVIDATVDLVWDPAWNQDMISEIGRMKLGMV